MAESRQSNRHERDPIARDETQALIGGVLGGGVAFGGAYVLGSVSGFEAVRLLEASLPTTRFLASSMLTASATILALMLTLLGVSHSTEMRLRDSHYVRVKRIAQIDTVGFVVAALFLLLLNIPLEQTEKVPATLYSWVYYGVLGMASALGATLIAVVLMLYHTVRDVIETIAGEGAGPLTHPDHVGAEES